MRNHTQAFRSIALWTQRTKAKPHHCRTSIGAGMDATVGGGEADVSLKSIDTDGDCRQRQSIESGGGSWRRTETTHVAVLNEIHGSILYVLSISRSILGRSSYRIDFSCSASRFSFDLHPSAPQPRRSPPPFKLKPCWLRLRCS